MADAQPLRPRMFEVTAAEISRLVACFYARIRAHDVLGPVFGEAISDWPGHEAKIEAFWRGAILRELSEIMDGSHVILDMSGSVSVDHDVLEIIHDFEESAQRRDIVVEIRGGPESLTSRAA